MIDFVIDANVLISALISGKASYRTLLTHFRFITPDYVFVEIEKYNAVISNKSNQSDEELKMWSYFIFSKITVLPRFILTENSIQKANILLEDIDLKDISYVALAMQLDLVLITRDKPLHDGLKKKGFRKVMLFDEFLRKIAI